MYPKKSIKQSLLFCLIIILLSHNTYSKIITSCCSISNQGTEERARLEGQVLTTNETPIPQAKIRLQHTDSGQTFYLQSNDKGSFRSDLIPPGKYVFSVEKEEYQSYSGELQLLPNMTQTLELVLAKEETLDQKQQKEAYLSYQEGVKLFEENKFEEALQAFQKTIELNPGFFDAYVNIGIIQFQQKKDNEAEKALLQALEIEPDKSRPKEILADIYYEKGKTLIRENNSEDALKILKSAYDFKPDHAYVNYLLGYLYVNQQMNDEAIKHFETFLQLEPESPNAARVKDALKKLKENSSLD